MENFIEQLKENLEAFGDVLMKVLKGEEGRKKQIVATILILLIGFNLVVRLIEVLPAILIGILMIKYLAKDNKKSEVDKVENDDIIDVE